MVAGASRGLGFAVARGLASEGVKVSIGSRDQGRIEAAASRIAAETQAETLATAVDVRSAGSLASWHAQTVERFGGVDLLFVNAGGPPAGTTLSFDDGAWHAAFELLVLSALRMVRLAVPSMKARGGGAIVLSTSTSVREPIPNLALSNIMRPSVAAISKTLASELAGDNIRVNHLLPGRIDTDRVRELDNLRAEQSEVGPEQQRAAQMRSIPLGRYGQPSEFANAAVFLLSDAACYITGASLQVDGGMIRAVI